MGIGVYDLSSITLAADIASTSDLWFAVDLPEGRMIVDKANRNQSVRGVFSP
jgi:hypothetical protein